MSLFSEACRYIPGGVNSPVRAFRAVGGEPLFIERASGLHVFDADGRRYVDFVGSWGPMILGHAHPSVVRDAAHRNRKRVLALDAETFLGRFLLHVLPQGFKRVRHYGLLAPGHKQHRLHACRRYFGAASTPAPEAPHDPATAVALLAPSAST